MKPQQAGPRTVSPTTSSEQYHAYNVWDAPTRWFHWINALAVFGLIMVGIILLNDDALELRPAARSCSSRSM